MLLNVDVCDVRCVRYFFLIFGTITKINSGEETRGRVAHGGALGQQGLHGGPD
jgi:hypothetical protein